MAGLPTISCPACLAEYGLEVALGQDDARGVIRELARCPGDAATRKALLRYCALHAPASQRLRWSRVEAILSEINGWMETARIERGGRMWAAPAAAYLTAIEAIEAKPDLTRPLKGHGLLLEILANMTAKADAQAERDRLASGRGETPVGAVAPAPAPTRTPNTSQTRDGTRAGLQSLRETLASIKTIQPGDRP